MSLASTVIRGESIVRMEQEIRYFSINSSSIISVEQSLMSRCEVLIKMGKN